LNLFSHGKLSAKKKVEKSVARMSKAMVLDKFRFNQPRAFSRGWNNPALREKAITQE